jgi:hypothetical protein
MRIFDNDDWIFVTLFIRKTCVPTVGYTDDDTLRYFSCKHNFVKINFDTEKVKIFSKIIKIRLTSKTADIL